MIIFDISKYYCIFVIETMIIELLSKHNAEIVTRLNRWIKRIFTCNKLKISDLIIIFGSQADHQRIRELHQSNSLFLCLKRAGLHGSVKPRVKPRMDFPDQFSKIFLAYQPFPSAPTRKFKAFMPSCPHYKHNKLTINHLYANGKNTCSHSYPHALTTFSRKISHSILFINHILSFL